MINIVGYLVQRWHASPDLRRLGTVAAGLLLAGTVVLVVLLAANWVSGLG